MKGKSLDTDPKRARFLYNIFSVTMGDFLFEQDINQSTLTVEVPDGELILFVYQDKSSRLRRPWRTWPCPIGCDSILGEVTGAVIRRNTMLTKFFSSLLALPVSDGVRIYGNVREILRRQLWRHTQYRHQFATP